MPNLRIAIMGCGKQAPKHISGLRRVPGLELVLADSDPERARELATKENLPWARHVDDVFEDASIQAIDICTPTPTHFDLICRTLASGKHFFCEKPLCETVSQAQNIRALMDKHDCIGMVGYIYRFAPVFEIGRMLFEDVARTGESMVLGRIVTAWMRLGGRGGHQFWKHQRSSGGGAINEMLVHMVDLAIWYFGRVRSAQLLSVDILRPLRMFGNEEMTVDAEDFVLARLETESGVTVYCQSDLVTPAFTQMVEVQGENGTFMGSIQEEMPSFVFCIEEAAGYAAGRTELRIGRRNLFEAQMTEFVRSVRRQVQPRWSTIDDSILLLEALDLLSGAVR